MGYASPARFNARSIAGTAAGAWTSARARKPRASVTKPVGSSIWRGPDGQDHHARLDEPRAHRQEATEWTTQAEALEALGNRLKDAEHGKVSKPADATLGALVETYLQ